MIRLALALIGLMAALPAQAAVEIQEVRSDGGITAWLVEEHSIPFVALEIRFMGGASLDAPGKRGAINLMTGLIEEGAGEMDARAFAEARESLAASFGFDVYDDALSVSAQFLTENRDQAVDLLRTALIDASFDDDAIARVRAQVLSIIRSDSTDPSKIANLAFQKLAWGEHPYGSDPNGTLDSVAALTRADILDAKARVMARDRIFVGVVGDISAADLKPLLDRLLGDLPATGAPMPPRADFLLKPGVTVIPFDTPQSVAIFGHQGIKLDDPDYFAAYLLNEAIGGGGFSSRLMEEVREKRGLTYGIGSYLATMDHGELLMGQVASANAKMAETIEVVRAEWARAATEGLTETELADAKTYLTGAYPLRFDGNATIANIMVGMQMNGFPLDYAETRNARVEAVTMADIRRVAQQLFRPGDLAFVVVGQPDGVESSN
jgi:zinc protease